MTFEQAKQLEELIKAGEFNTVIYTSSLGFLTIGIENENFLELFSKYNAKVNGKFVQLEAVKDGIEFTTFLDKKEWRAMRNAK